MGQPARATIPGHARGTRSRGSPRDTPIRLERVMFSGDCTRGLPGLELARTGCGRRVLAGDREPLRDGLRVPARVAHTEDRDVTLGAEGTLSDTSAERDAVGSLWLARTGERADGDGVGAALGVCVFESGARR